MAEATEVPVRSGGITKIEAVKQALEKLVKDATRTDIQTYIKEQFGIDMSLDHITHCKGELKHKAAKAKKMATPKMVMPKPEASTAVASKPSSKAASTKAAPTKPVAKASAVSKPAMPKVQAMKKKDASIGLEDIQTAKELIGRFGREQLRSLVDLLAK